MAEFIKLRFPPSLMTRPITRSVAIALSSAFHIVFALLIVFIVTPGREITSPAESLRIDLVSSSVDSSKSIDVLNPGLRFSPRHRNRVRVSQAANLAVERTAAEPVTAAAESKTVADAMTGAAPPASAQSERARRITAEDVYVQDLRLRLEAKKEYPVAARRLGQQGRVVVRLIVGRDGRVRDAKIISASASAILNRAARELIDALGDLKPFPREIQLTEWAMTIPIDYRL